MLRIKIIAVMGVFLVGMMSQVMGREIPATMEIAAYRWAGDANWYPGLSPDQKTAADEYYQLISRGMGQGDVYQSSKEAIPLEKAVKGYKEKASSHNFIMSDAFKAMLLQRTGAETAQFFLIFWGCVRHGLTTDSSRYYNIASRFFVQLPLDPTEGTLRDSASALHLLIVHGTSIKAHWLMVADEMQALPEGQHLTMADVTRIFEGPVGAWHKPTALAEDGLKTAVDLGAMAVFAGIGIPVKILGGTMPMGNPGHC